MRITADCSRRTLKARRTWNDVFQTLKENYSQPRLLYPSKLYFIIEKLKTLCDKEKLKQFMTTRLALQKILKGIYTQKRKINTP
jgi:hypothetical protein